MQRRCIRSPHDYRNYRAATKNGCGHWVIANSCGAASATPTWPPKRAYRAEREQKIWRVLIALHSEQHGDWAVIEIHAVYESQTGAGEEIPILAYERFGLRSSPR